MGKKPVFLLVSLGITGALLYLIFSQQPLEQWTRLLSRIRTDLLGVYAGLYSLGLLIRTGRYRLLLKGSGAVPLPGFGPLVLVTSVRNMLVDLLPARSGSLSYLVILNRVFAVDLPACLTSFTYAALFDLLTLGPLLAVVLLIDAARGNPADPLLWGLGLAITLGGFLVIAFLEPLFRTLSGWLEDRVLSGRETRAGSRRVLQGLSRLGRSFLTLRRARLFWPLLGLSLLLRIIKYTLLYLLLYAVTEALLDSPLSVPFLRIMFGIMASEVAASLPVSGLAGFGLYEGILGGTLAGQGISASQGVFISFAMHLLSQVFEYSLGAASLALILVIWVRSGGQMGSKGQP